MKTFPLLKFLIFFLLIATPSPIFNFENFFIFFCKIFLFSKIISFFSFKDFFKLFVNNSQRILSSSDKKDLFFLFFFSLSSFSNYKLPVRV